MKNWKKVKAVAKVSIQIHVRIWISVCLWCKILCHEDGKEHSVSSRYLEPEDSELLKDSDLKKEGTLLWKVKGKDTQ